MKILRVTVRVDAHWNVDVLCAGASLSRRTMRRLSGAGDIAFPLPPSDALPDPARNPLCTADTAAVIENERARIHRRDLDEDTLVHFGAYLFEALIGEACFRAIEARAKVDGADLVDLALAWIADDRALHRLNWELMCRYNDAGKPVFLASGTPRRISITRLVAGARQAMRPMGGTPRVLFVIGDEIARERLRAGAEVVGLLQELAAEGRTVCYEIVQRATAKRTREAIASFKPDVVHFVCHGGVGDTGRTHLDLSPEGEAKGECYPEQILSWFGGSPPPIVVLSACHSGAMLGPYETAPFAAELVAGGVPMVVGMAGRVSDMACRLFTRRFGEALVNGEPIVAATEEGRRAAFSEGQRPWRTADWAFPAVFMTESVAPDFATPPADAVSRAIEERVKLYGVKDVPVFCARHELMEAFFAAVKREHSVLVVYAEAGARKLGCTRLLKQMTAAALRGGHVPVALLFPIPLEPRPKDVESLMRALSKAVHRARLSFGLDAARLLQTSLLLLKKTRSLEELADDEALDPAVRGCIANSGELGVGAYKLALQKDLLDLVAGARQAHPGVVTPASRAVLLLDDVHDYVDALEPLLFTLLDRAGLRSLGEPIPVVVTFARGGARDSVLGQVVNGGMCPDWDVRRIAPFSDKGEDMLAYERVLMHPYQTEDGVPDEDKVSSVPWVFDYTAPPKTIKDWEKLFRKRVRGIPDEMRSDVFYVTVEDAKREGFAVRATDDKVLARMRQERSS